ncbi:hypothetical protein [Corynebacterium sphenisci]|uniref:hypothetical protein n=1 Tax=Corynebacterium sphenisci TaxID=191493 RepID=UPI0026DF7643|nr:hypothetical protein [Corynebacterium sphenisci]MDO5732124.1 hypothetical protein [Corynebacterium sphenisci]
MRSPLALLAGLAAAALLAGCDGADEPPAPTTTTAESTTTRTAEQTEKIDPSPTSRSIIAVDEADFTPPDGPNARIFVLADGTTTCYYNEIGDGRYLSCGGEFTDPPMVEGPDGRPTPANAVSFTPEGILFQSLTFPGGAYSPRTLNAGEALTAYGYTCTAEGPSAVTCTGPQGTAAIRDGRVTGATVPEPAEPAAEDPEEPAADAADGAEGEDAGGHPLGDALGELFGD